MRIHQMWILGLCLSWLCAPAQAAPFRDGPGGNGDDHGASSLHSKANRLSKDGGRFDGIWQVSVGSLPPGLEKRGGLLPHGLDKRGGFLPHGLDKRSGLLPHGLVKNDAFLPPGLEKKGAFFSPGPVKNDEFFPPADLPGGAGVVPEPTALILFGGGLLLAGASERRRRRS